MLAFQLALVVLFLAVAHWLDRENRRVTAENTSLTDRLSRAEASLVEVTGELVAYRSEDAQRYSFVIPHIPSETIAYPGCECAGCWRVRAGFN